jgi:rhamnulokinase
MPAAGLLWRVRSRQPQQVTGVELPAPLLGEEALAANFTNEGGVAGTVRLLKNVMGLWLVQECRRAWERAGKSYDYAELVQFAEAAPAFTSLVDPDDSGFLLPASMPSAIADFCRKHQEPAPDGPGATVRCCLESLALKYRWVLEKVEALTRKPLDVVHVVGGGCQNALLCQFTADACGRPVVAGPIEATAAGNVLTQSLGLGIVGSLADAREIIRRSFDLVTYEPKNAWVWDVPYQRLRRYLRES